MNESDEKQSAQRSTGSVTKERNEEQSERSSADNSIVPAMEVADSRTAAGADLYRLLVDSVQDYAIFALDAAGTIVSWNSGAARVKGYAADEIIGRHFSTFYTPEDLAAGRPAHLLAIAARDSHVEDEGWRVRKDGSRFWANVVLTALRNDGNRLVGFAKVTRDLTERREADERLRLSEGSFRLLVQSVQDYAIFMLDPEGRVATWNDGAVRIKGYTAEEILGSHFSIFYPPDDVARGKPAAELTIAARDGRVEDEGWRLRKDGSRFWANVVITALLDPDDGSLIGFAKVTRDLTERHLAQERAIDDARRIAAVEAASRAKTEFLAVMSHELRTPLNAIGGYVDLLKMELRGPVTGPQLQDLDRIQHAQRHLLALINDVLNYSRLEAGRVTYDIHPMPLIGIIEAVAPLVESQAQRGGITFERGPVPRVSVVADPGKTEQILLNLLSNALKFTPEGGRVLLSGKAEGGRVAISVADTGVGIPEQEKERIFEPFVQLGRSLTTRQEGAGLGLAISRDLARGMGGDLRVESAPGEGATFILELPGAAPLPP